MSIRKKIVLFTASIFLSGIIILFYASETILLKRFAELEEENLREKLNAAKAALEHEVSVFSRQTDDIVKNHQLESTHNPRHLRVLASDSPDTMLLLTDPSGNIISNKSSEIKRQNMSSSSLSNLAISLLSAPASKTESIQDLAGIHVVPEGPLLVAIRPIEVAENVHQTPLFLIAVRFLMNSEIDSPLAALISNGQFKTVSPEDEGQLADTNKTIIETDGSHLLKGVAVLEDILGNPLFLFFEEERTLYLKGSDSVSAFMIMTISVALTCVLMVLLLLEKTVLKRWAGLIKKMSYIRQSQNLADRAIITGKDEISKMEREFNQLLASLEKSQKKILHLAYHDNLTNLPNRAFFHESFQSALRKAQKGHHFVAVLFIDLNGFKQINDAHGHDIGDQVLIEVANRLNICTRLRDVASRIGGDEFIILLPEIQSEAEAEQIAIRIQEEISKPTFIKDQLIPLSASIGSSIYPIDGRDSETLLRNADKRMYVVKEAEKALQTTV